MFGSMFAKSPDSLIAQIQALSETKRDLSQLLGVLKNSESLIKSNDAVAGSIMDQLDASKHSLGYLYALDAYSRGKRTSEVVVRISTFIESCDAKQISMAADKFVSVCRRVKDYAMSVKEPIRAVKPMITAARKLQSSSPDKLTTLHPDALLLCVLAKCYKPGLSLLEEEVYEVDQPKDFLLYCYYGGMVCIGQKQFGKASELLHKAVTSPMNNLSAIAVEAYKKYVLVSLIHSGQFSTALPKYASSVAQKNIKNFAKLYVDFANKCEAGKFSENLKSFVQENQWRFNDDNNLGLANQAVDSMYKRSIQRLTKTYVTLSLADIAERVSLKDAKEAEMHVLQMIQDGEVYALINQKDGMVTFMEDPEQYKTCDMVEQMDSSIERIMGLSKKLAAMDENMACDPMYLKKSGKESHMGFNQYGDYGENFGEFEDHPMMQRERRSNMHRGMRRERNRYHD